MKGTTVIETHDFRPARENRTKCDVCGRTAGVRTHGQPAPRQKRGEGSRPVWVESRSAFRVRLPRQPGKRWQPERYIKGTGPDDTVAEAAAWRVLREGLHARDKGAAVALDRRTLVGPWTIRYGAELATNLRPESRRQYLTLAKHIDREVGRIKLVDLRASDVSGMLNRLEARGISADRRAAVLSALRTSLDAAIKDDRIIRNVAEAVDRPPKTRKRRRPIAEGDVAAILAHVAADPVYGAAYAITASAGLRQAEVCGLRWRDLVGSTLIVDGQIERRGDYVIDPKSEAGRRAIVLPAWVVESLAARRRWQLADGSAGSEGYIFTTPTAWRGHSHRPAGSVMRPTQLWLHLQGVCDELGIARYTWHGFRHAVATRLLARGVDVEVVRQTMGHSTLATTAGYLHTSGGDDLVNALDPLAGRRVS